MAQFTSELRDFIPEARSSRTPAIEDEICLYLARCQPAVTLHGYLATSGVADYLHFANLAREVRLARTLQELESIVERFPPS